MEIKLLFTEDKQFKTSNVEENSTIRSITVLQFLPPSHN